MSWEWIIAGGASLFMIGLIVGMLGESWRQRRTVRYPYLMAARAMTDEAAGNYPVGDQGAIGPGAQMGYPVGDAMGTNPFVKMRNDWEATPQFCATCHSEFISTCPFKAEGSVMPTTCKRRIAIANRELGQ